MPRLVLSISWLYAGLILVTWAIVRWAPADFWPMHLFLYGPRWVVAIPLLLLVPSAAWWRSIRSAPALGIASVAFLSIWGFVLPGWNSAEENAPNLRLLTCNVQFDDLKVGALADLIREARPDLVLLQECRLADPTSELGLEGWHVRSEGEFCLASRFPIAGLTTLRRPDKAYRTFAIRAEVSWSGRTISVVSAHLMTPRNGLEAMIRSPVGGLKEFRKVATTQRFESELLRDWIAKSPGSIVLAGDLNLTAEHPLFRRDWSGYANAFSETGWGLGRTMSTRKIGLRIDHILSGPEWMSVRSWVDRDVGSAHRPFLADLSWIGLPADRTD
jgi:vancomycin resistance protein VanJ